MELQDQQRNLGHVIAKAWSDPTFKRRLIADPKAVLAEMGVETPEGVEIGVVENTAEKTYLTLPATPLSKPTSDGDVIVLPWGPYMTSIEAPCPGPTMSPHRTCYQGCQ